MIEQPAVERTGGLVQRLGRGPRFLDLGVEIALLDRPTDRESIDEVVVDQQDPDTLAHRRPSSPIILGVRRSSELISTPSRPAGEAVIEATCGA
jgi:hypothetical protein